MYKIVIFSKSVLLPKNMLFLGSFERFFRKSHQKIFLTPRHVLKVIFSGKFLENLIFECQPILAQPWFLSHLILHFLLHLLMWKNRVGVCRSKSYGFFTIPDSKKKFRNFRVNQFEWIHGPINEYQDTKIVGSNVFSPFPIQFITPFGHNYENSSIPFN